MDVIVICINTRIVGSTSRATLHLPQAHSGGDRGMANCRAPTKYRRVEVSPESTLWRRVYNVKACTIRMLQAPGGLPQLIVYRCGALDQRISVSRSGAAEICINAGARQAAPAAEHLKRKCRLIIDCPLHSECNPAQERWRSNSRLRREPCGIRLRQSSAETHPLRNAPRCPAPGLSHSSAWRPVPAVDAPPWGSGQNLAICSGF